MRLIAIAGLVGAMWAAGGVLAQPQEVTLRIQREPGQVLKYRAEVSGAGEVVLLGESQPISVRGRFTRVERTLSQAAPDAWVVRVTIEDPSLTFRSGTERQTVAMQVPPLEQVVNDRGAVSEVRGWDPAQATVSAPGMGDAVRPLFGLIQEQGLPERPLRPGDTWTSTARLKMPQGPDQQVEQRFELAGLREVGGVLCAEIRSTADLPIRRDLPANAIGMQVGLEGSQRLESISLVACEQGMLLRQETNITLDLKTSTILIPETPEATMPGAISLRVKVMLELER